MMTMTGRGWAYAGATLGATVSIAANVSHSYVPPAGAPNGWHPHVGAVIGAVFWPVALLVAIEIMSRVPWPDGHRWALLRYGGLVPVAAVAALVSYRHLSGLLAYYGEDTATSTLGPLAVDGLMVMATGALIATAAVRTNKAVGEVAVPSVEPLATAEDTEATTKREHIVAALTTTAGDVAKARQLLADRGVTAGREYVYRVRREAWQNG